VEVKKLEKLKNVEDLKDLRNVLSKEKFLSYKPRLRVCCGPACSTLGSHTVAQSLENEIQKKGLEVEVVKTGCHGMCQKGTNVKVEPHGYYYQRVQPHNIPHIVDYTFLKGTPYRPNLYRDSVMSEPLNKLYDIPFYQKQLRVVLRNVFKIDPTDIYHYIGIGGYAALEWALSKMTPEDALKEVERANLRGRGGAGFPAGRKWRHVKRAPGKIKFVVANGDEGDPGAFMDRAVMEGDPHSLLEGMLLCAYAIGAEYGFIYVRHEYPLAVKHLKIAIKQAEEVGLLGDNILGTNFNFYLDIREGAGAFVCGESTALVASIEGERGFPRPRPPRLSEVGGGVWGYPTDLNNIETFACVPPIIENGAEWFGLIGTITSPGTKVFALSGKVANTGLVEVPMGTTLREIIFDIGGGIAGDKKFKAVQTGGPSGGCLPAKYLDLPVNFDSLKSVGSIMGSGGMIVMDEDTCMVDVARYFLSFTQSESCGKCHPCRIGTYQMLQILERITSGKGEHGDIEKLSKLGKLIQKGSLCGLGQSAPNPVLSTIKYFREEYEEHIYEKYCRANVCSGMGMFIIDEAECIMCGLCKKMCAFNAIEETRERYYIDRDYCTKCRACYNACPINAIKIEKQHIIELEEQLRIPPEKIGIFERRGKMTLKGLLESKPSKIVTCKPTCFVSDAVSIMNENKVGSILIFDVEKKLLGIFTERDLMQCFSKHINFNTELIQNVMTTAPVTLDAVMEISAAVSIMSEKKIRHLPVTEDDKVIGMISYRDLVSYLLPEVIFMSEDIY
jgi:NADH-quinone oxidoreductase subunit F/NADP-reducing hydrogenase subunit HndC